ncbi:GNAT family N-acetyltransferase [Spirochaeta cellobiosiphila]|uniref:GNAT family N-acetyltransferase n=1 Tax=Spirochaeta cellobiosiphila TaxID=504483 RepID=UPI000419ED88|nr:GNAT family N-acetyltransferase [Spirochaeta cellobiosiphila]
MDIKLFHSINDIDESDWILLQKEATPFFQYHWLHKLEQVGLLHFHNGWKPIFVTAWEDDVLVACLCLYEKKHSQGEFVWDYAWANVAQQIGVSYYPKLVGTQAFTASPGTAILIKSQEYSEVRNLLIDKAKSLLTERGYPSLHLLWWKADQEPPQGDFVEWTHQYFLWSNQNYGSMEDFLYKFKKNQRRNIQKELRTVQEAGIQFQILTEEDLTPEILEFIWDCYYITNEKFGPWGALYLSKEFFMSLGDGLVKGIRVFVAQLDGRNIAMSLLFEDNNCLYGRYWGTLEYHDCLHFVLCYYEPIRYCIQKGISSFDPGMGSPHKARRGFSSHHVSSYHYFTNPLMQQIMAKYIPQINEETDEEIQILNNRIPWKEK